jgi:hypothetical protein
MTGARGIIALLLLAGLGVALIRAATPDRVETPRGMVEAGIDQAHADADRGRPDAPARHAAGGGAAGGVAGDPLAVLIAAKGYGCERVVSAEAVDPREGLFDVACRSAAGWQATYRVDTRRDRVTPAGV